MTHRPTEKEIAARRPLLAVRILRGLLWSIAWLVALGCAAWAFGALHYDLPIWKGPVAWAFAISVLAAVVFLRGAWRKLGATLLGFTLVLAWWLTLEPSNEGSWQPDVSRLAWAEINGDEVTFHNVRNCDYRTETDYTPCWETRTVSLSQLTGIDVAIDYWGSPWMAHPIASFQFANAPPVCFSIETRKKVAQSYSAIGGLYRQFALIFIVADERDVIRVRTNYRDEDIYLYLQNELPNQEEEGNRVPAPEGDFKATMQMDTPKYDALIAKGNPPPIKNLKPSESSDH